MIHFNTDGIRVVVADKSPLVRSGLAALIKRDRRFDLVEAVGDGDAFLDAVEIHAFDVGVIGWDMEGMGGKQVLHALKNYKKPPRIVVYTGNSGAAIPRRTMQLGGAGFCSKSGSTESLLETIVAVSEGRMIFPFMDVRLSAGGPFGNLTAREQDLLEALSQGRMNAQIAGDLGISLNTVKFHLKNLYGKLGVKNRAQAVASYLQGDGY